MKRQNGKKKTSAKSFDRTIYLIKEELKKEDKTLHAGLEYIKKHLDKLWEHVAETNERLMDLEIQSNLMTRLVTTICIERLKMQTEVLTKLIRRIEKEAIEDSQIMHLEQLYSLEHDEEKQVKHKHKTKDAKPPEAEPPSI
ncbi:MAG: hypothetical protein HZC17_09575 [Candidatus Omnitrophica bacterium]|nr:hypothetical protein [Candidatus Omnitrophota bacterium]